MFKQRLKSSNITNLQSKIDKLQFRLPVVFGYDENDQLIIKDFHNIGNILITGATGSGKSVFGHTIIYTLMNLYDPSYVSFYLIDMKRVEFSHYKGLAYLNADPLYGLYDEFNNVIRTMEGFIQDNPDSEYTVVLIDTFSDLICHDREKFETLIKRLSEKDNTFLVMWDSRPHTDVYTENIQKCFKTKIVQNMVSGQDSVFFCGSDVGSTLLGKGDSVVFSNAFDKPTRFQIPNITYEEIKESLDKKHKYLSAYIEDLDLNKVKPNFGGPEHPEKDDELIYLFGKAHNDQIPVYSAIIEIDAIKPHSAYKPKPETMKGFKSMHIERLNKGQPPMLHVYPKGDSFIMSDDYVAYYTYLDLGFDSVHCILLGDSDSPKIVEKERIRYRL